MKRIIQRRSGVLWLVAAILFAGALAGCKSPLVTSGEDTVAFDQQREDVEGSTDEQSMAKIALEEEDRPTRYSAVKRITDEEVLKHVAREDDDWRIRRLAVEKMSDADVLAGIAHNDRNASVRQAAVRRIQKVDVLVRVAEEDRDVGVRSAAVHKVSDPEVLARIAVNDESALVRRLALVRHLAVEKITDENLLYEFSADPAWNVRHVALEKITNESLLGDIALETAYWDVCRVILGRAADPEALLERVVVENEHPAVRRSAVNKITDQTLLAEVTREDENPDVRNAAVARLTDNDLLAMVALEYENEATRIEAVRRLTDDEVLGKIARDDEAASVRLAAVKRIDDQTVLSQIALEGENEAVRAAAAERLDNEDTLAKIAFEDESMRVRRSAVKNLSDKRLLAQIAVEDEDSFVRGEAAKKLTEVNDWGEWKFRKDPDEIGLEEGWYGMEFDDSDWKPIDTPAHWGDTWAGSYLGYGWYRVKFELLDFEGDLKAFLIQFSGIDEQAWVYVNGQYVGEQSVESDGEPIGVLWDKHFAVGVDTDILKSRALNLLTVRVHASIGGGGIFQPVKAYFFTP